jgi:hypothetical protein
MKDVFLEKIITRKKGPFEFFIKFMIILTLITVILTINMLVAGIIPQLLGVSLLISCGLIYLSYRLFISLNTEYEYSLTNDEFSVDRIVAKRKRKQIYSSSCKGFDRVAPISDSGYIGKLESAKALLDISSGGPRELTWYISLSQSGVNKVILIDYDERFIEAFRRYNPRTVAAVTTEKTEVKG